MSYHPRTSATQHDPLTCGLAHDWEQPTCPGCRAELPRRDPITLAEALRIHEREEQRLRRPLTRPVAQHVAQLIRDHADVLVPVLWALLRERIAALIAAALEDHDGR